MRRSIIGGKRVHIMMHRVITSCPDGREPDHIDGDGLNNTRGNLRVSTHAENMRNQPSHTARHKGIDFHKASNKWRTRIRVGNNLIVVGYFKIEEEAARAYDEAALKYHGEFARLNFPQSQEAKP